MNKYLGLFVFAVFLLLTGFLYAQYYRPKEVGEIKSTGKLIEIQMRVLENQWKWEPSLLRVNPGDRVRLHIFNEDTYDHGFGIDVFGVNRRLFPRKTTIVEFTASLEGKFHFYCSVPCGEGHYDQIGTIVVGDQETPISSVPARANNSCAAFARN